MGRGQRGRLQSRRFAAAQALGRGRSVGVRSKDGIRLHAEVFGPEDGYPVVLAHGITCAIRVWAYQIADLAKDHRVIAFDHRGHGRSAVPARRSGYSLDCLAGDIDAVLEATLKPGSAPSSRATRWAASRSRPGRSGIPSGSSTRRRRRPDQHHDRRPDSPRAIPSGAATAGRRQGSRGRHAAEDVRRGASAACGRPAEPAVRLDDRGGPRRRPRDRRVRLPAVQRDTARGPRRLGPRARRLAGMHQHIGLKNLTVPTMVIGSEKDRLLPMVSSRRIAKEVPNLAQFVELPAATARSWTAPTRSTSNCAG